MTDDQLQLAAYQIGMIRAAQATDPQAIADWRALQSAAAVARERVGPVYQCYPYPNRALIKAAYNALQEDHDYRDFGAVLSCVRGEWR